MLLNYVNWCCFNIVAHASLMNSTNSVVFARNVGWCLDQKIDGNQRSFNTFQHHQKPFHALAKNVQHVEFGNVGRCWMEMSDPFFRGL